MTPEELFDELNHRLDGLDGTLDDYRLLLTNHLTEYSQKFDSLQKDVKHALELNEKDIQIIDLKVVSLRDKIDGYKWVLITTLGITALIVAGFIALALK